MSTYFKISSKPTSSKLSAQVVVYGLSCRMIELEHIGQAGMIRFIIDVSLKPELKYFNTFILLPLLLYLPVNLKIHVHVCFLHFQSANTDTHSDTDCAHGCSSFPGKEDLFFPGPSLFALMSSCVSSHWGFTDTHKTTRATFLCVSARAPVRVCVACA